MTEYQYKECGLDYVYLLNGFTAHDTAYGSGVSVKNANQLHQMIAECIIKGQRRIRGQELRFLRSVMDVSQTRLGQMLGIERSRVAQLEADPEGNITKTLDNLLRYRYASFIR